MNGYAGYGMSGWMWVWGAVLVIGVLALIGGLAWAIVSTIALRRAPQIGSTSVSARQLLDERYARGDMDTQDYRERVQALNG